MALKAQPHWTLAQTQLAFELYCMNKAISRNTRKQAMFWLEVAETNRTRSINPTYGKGVAEYTARQSQSFKDIDKVWQLIVDELAPKV